MPNSKWPIELRHRSGGQPTTRMGPEEALTTVLTNGKAFAALARASHYFTKLCPHVSTHVSRYDDQDDLEDTLVT